VLRFAEYGIDTDRRELGRGGDQGRLVAAMIPGARLVSLDSDNHLPLHGEPAFDRMVREILTFLG
jgi:hypothetical protein